MNKVVEKWGCPSWRDKDKYPASIDLLEEWEWRWQFLRRNEVYRTWFSGLEYVPLTTGSMAEDDNVRGFGDGNENEGVRRMGRYLFNMAFLLNPRIDRPVSTPFKSHIGGELLELPSSEHFEELWPKDPQKRFEALMGLLVSYGIIKSERSPPEWHLIKYQMLYFQFDPWRSFKTQAERAKRIFEVESAYPVVGARKKRLGGKDRQFWPRYLRVVDADDQGASPSEIFLSIKGDELHLDDYDALFAEDKNVSQAGKNMIKSARDVMSKVSHNL